MITPFTSPKENTRQQHQLQQHQRCRQQQRRIPGRMRTSRKMMMRRLAVRVKASGQPVNKPRRTTGLLNAIQSSRLQRRDTRKRRSYRNFVISLTSRNNNNSSNNTLFLFLVHPSSRLQLSPLSLLLRR